MWVGLIEPLVLALWLHICLITFPTVLLQLLLVWAIEDTLLFKGCHVSSGANLQTTVPLPISYIQQPRQVSSEEGVAFASRHGCIYQGKCWGWWQEHSHPSSCRLDPTNLDVCILSEWISKCNWLLWGVTRMIACPRKNLCEFRQQEHDLICEAAELSCDRQGRLSSQILAFSGVHFSFSCSRCYRPLTAFFSSYFWWDCVWHFVPMCPLVLSWCRERFTACVVLLFSFSFLCCCQIQRQVLTTQKKRMMLYFGQCLAK